MKIKVSGWSLIPVCLTIMVNMVMVSCSDYNEPAVPTSNPTPEISSNSTGEKVLTFALPSHKGELGSPIARIKLTTSMDTVCVSSADQLMTVTDMSGEIEFGQSASQLFTCGALKICLDWSYVNCETKATANSSMKPYYTLEPAVIKEVSVKKSGTGIVNNKGCDIFDVTTTFSQQAVPKNMPEDTRAFEIVYSAKYMGAVEADLVMVEYYPGGEWIDPHDNLALAYYAHVERYRTYSNGERVGPDIFYDYGHISGVSCGGGEPIGYHGLPDGEWNGSWVGGGWIDGGPLTSTMIGDSIALLTQSIKVWELARYSFETFQNDWHQDNKVGDWDKYWVSKTYDNPDIDMCNGISCPQDYEYDSRPSGWYFFELSHNYSIEVIPDNHWYGIDGSYVTFTINDQFLLIDGRRIDFSKLHNMKLDHRATQQPFSTPEKEGIVTKLELNASFLGKNFYCADIDSIFIEK